MARLANKPQYLFHPLRLARRVLRPAPTGSGSATETTQLPWGLPLDVYRADAIGYSIITGGVFDPCVTEALHRLIDPGDLVVDVGANVGYVTSLAAMRAGPGGGVVAYEPHPHVFSVLESNVARWDGDPRAAKVELHRAALSDAAGTGELVVPPRSHENMGLAALEGGDLDGLEGAERVEVPLERLDEALGERAIGVLKIDVEGHEPGVLRGARGALEAGRVRDIVFEDHEDYPDESTKIVEDAGYSLFTLDNGLFGLQVGAPSERGEVEGWPGPSYLATRDPDRALARLRARGWQVRGIGPALPRLRRG